MVVVNLFGAPDAGKSTGAAYVFSQLKMKGINAELITEFAKDKVWEGSKEAFKNQAYIFGEQFFRLSRCADKVEVAVVDSPLPLSILYNENPALKTHFNLMIMDVFNSYDNMNYFVQRIHPYNETGRRHTEEEANRLEQELTDMLSKYNIPCKYIGGDTDGYDQIVKEIWNKVRGT